MLVARGQYPFDGRSHGGRKSGGGGLETPQKAQEGETGNGSQKLVRVLRIQRPVVHFPKANPTAVPSRDEAVCVGRSGRRNQSEK